MRLQKAAIATCCVAAVLGPAASAASADGSFSDEIFVVTLSKQSTSAAIAAQASGDAQYRQEALALTSEWQSQLEAGGSLSLGSLTQGRSRAASAQAVGELRETLNEQQSVNSTSGQISTMSVKKVSPTKKSPQKKSSKTPVTALASRQNPNGFPVRGAASASGKTWTGLKLVVSGAFCSSSGCGPVTDRITCRLSVKPSAASARFDSNCTYSPSTGRFGEKHFELWSISSGALVGTTDTSNLFSDDGGAGSYLLPNVRDLQGSALANAATLWVYAKPLGQYVSDSAKTDEATCRPEGSCRYSD